MKIKCGKCKEFILYKENFSNKFSCMDLDDCEKCGLCLILFFLLLSLALLIAFAYLYEVTPNPTYKSNYIAGIVVTGVSFLIFAFLLPLMLKNKFYNFDPDSIYRHPENLKEWSILSINNNIIVFIIQFLDYAAGEWINLLIKEEEISTIWNEFCLNCMAIFPSVIFAFLLHEYEN